MLFKRIFGDSNEKYLKRISKLVEKINNLEPKFEKFSDKELKERIFEFKEKAKDLRTEKEVEDFLNEILVEVFALVREASKRTLQQRHFDVQIMGGIALHEGKVVQMLTGEGKTLAATLAVALNGILQKGVHIVTVNDYLARRDAVWMGQIYNLLGLSVGCLNHEQYFLYDSAYKKTDTEKDKIRDELGSFYIVEDFLRACTKKEAYLADITYGTNTEFGFDYLRDNMAHSLSGCVQRELNFSIIDEVDSILIDEARTPLIISQPQKITAENYYKFAEILEKLKKDIDYNSDEKMKSSNFTEEGQEKIVNLLGFDPWKENDISTSHKLGAALRAKVFFQIDKDYVIKDGKITIVDEFTGRLLPGRRFSGGLHQAIEAKEHIRGNQQVSVQPESETIATISLQNCFRLYKKISGMTGTAVNSAEEFDKVYGLEVAVIPPNKPMIRKDFPDRVYKTDQEKFKAIVGEIKARHKEGQPLLVGTKSIERNEYLGKLLEREGVPHQILNAKNHKKEGQIIAQAGKLGAVTIATNMAGRGVDIILGGNPLDLKEREKILSLGGLYVVGTERHEDRRIDNQLRGRGGRQGDPGSSRFFLSLEDDLIRVFGGEKIKTLMERLNFPADQPIESKIVSNLIESAQRKIEGMNFDLRKHVLEYDDVMNKHRQVFYKRRKEILEKSEDSLRFYILELVKKAGYKKEDYEIKEKEVGKENMRQIEKFVCLGVFDSFWREHLKDMEELRDSVGLRAYGHQDPLVEYKIEGHKRFKKLLEIVETAVADFILKVKTQPKTTSTTSTSEPQFNRPGQKKKPGRNDPCPCGSNKKYKKCCYPKFG